MVLGGTSHDVEVAPCVTLLLLTVKEYLISSMKNVGGSPTRKRPSYAGNVASISDTSQHKIPLVPIANMILLSVCYALFFGLIFSYTFIIMFGETWLLPKDDVEWCRAAQQGFPEPIRHYPNPDCNNNPCYYERTLYLFGLNQFETTFSRRMIVSVLLGGVIGFERKAADRPAGVRTMSLVSLGSCFFTMCGQHAFRSSPQEFDAARVSAAIPSGVGFLGSALIWKHAKGLGGSGGHEVHGLTTAASVWLSASIGIGSGGGLFLLSTYATALVIFVLRIGPRFFFVDDASSVNEDYDTEDWGSTADEQEEEEERPPTREEQRQMLEEQASMPSLLSNPSLRSSSLLEHTSSVRRSVRDGDGLQRRKSRASLVTFGS